MIIEVGTSCLEMITEVFFIVLAIYLRLTVLQVVEVSSYHGVSTPGGRGGQVRTSIIGIRGFISSECW